jgi:ribosomal-protein-alanine N-acetyltransferase
VVNLIPPDPALTGGRIRLRPFRPADAEAVASACQDPDIPRFTMMAESLTMESAEDWIRRGLDAWSAGVARFAITVLPSDQCVGQVGIGFEIQNRRAEAFYWLDHTVRGRGLASEALNLVTAWAFGDHDIVRVQLVTRLDNLASHAVAQRCGYTREGVLRAWQPVKTTHPDVIMWSRLANDLPIPAPPISTT